MPAGIGLVIMISCQTAISQKCHCTDSAANSVPIFVSDSVSFLYMRYYESNYRGGTRENFQKHSESVDFSKTAFKEFLQKGIR